MTLLSNTLPSGAVGVYGLTTNHAGIRGHSTNYRGVWGSSTNGVGAYGASTNDTGVVGSGGAIGGAGVKAFGGSDPGPAQGSAVYGRGAGTAHIGVRGGRDSGNGVQGTSVSSSGVLGISTAARSVYGQIPNTSNMPNTTAVHGENLSTGADGIGVEGTSAAGLGGSFQGGLAPLRIVPGTASARTLAAAGHQAGELYVTNDNRLFFHDGTNWRDIVLAAPGSAVPPEAPARATTQDTPPGQVQPAPQPRSG